jgi:hypothetical protein
MNNVGTSTCANAKTNTNTPSRWTVLLLAEEEEEEEEEESVLNDFEAITRLQD